MEGHDIENPYISFMRHDLDALPPLSPRPGLCIYRVPERLRCVTKDIVTPKVISIGPFHHGGKHLQALEEHKKRYLIDFIKRTGVSLEDYIKIIKDREERLRNCYAETIKYNSDEFVRIILVDAAFIIELLVRFRFYELYDENDRIFNKPWMYIEEVWPDMLLLENQLPLFILHELFDPGKVGDFYDSRVHGSFDIISLSYDFFGTLLHREEMESDNDRVLNSPVVPEHFVDLSRRLYVPLQRYTRGRYTRGSMAKKKDTLGRVRLTRRTPNMTELFWAGVKFKARPSNKLHDIQFRNGILEIPKLAIGNGMDLLFRNMLAFEQCHCRVSWINDYVAFLHRLAHTPKDVTLLVEHGIVEDRVGDSNEVSTLINNLVAGVIMDPNYFLFADLCDHLNKYCTAPGRSWRATWAQYLYNKRWETFSISAFFILLLTIIQTVCSIISLKHK